MRLQMLERKSGELSEEELRQAPATVDWTPSDLSVHVSMYTFDSNRLSTINLAELLDHRSSQSAGTGSSIASTATSPTTSLSRNSTTL
jgi:Ca2+-binding EF-hand superfamily protein